MKNFTTSTAARKEFNSKLLELFDVPLEEAEGVFDIERVDIEVRAKEGEKKKEKKGKEREKETKGKKSKKQVQEEEEAEEEVEEIDSGVDVSSSSKGKLPAKGSKGRQSVRLQGKGKHICSFCLLLI